MKEYSVVELRSAKRLLARALKLIQRGWSKHAYARNAKGDIVPPKSNRAVAWCTLGAIVRATRTGEHEDVASRAARHALSNALDGVGEVLYNDAVGRRRRDVISKFRKAIAVVDKEMTVRL